MSDPLAGGGDQRLDEGVDTGRCRGELRRGMLTVPLDGVARGRNLRCRFAGDVGGAGVRPVEGDLDVGVLVGVEPADDADVVDLGALDDGGRRRLGGDAEAAGRLLVEPTLVLHAVAVRQHQLLDERVDARAGHGELRRRELAIAGDLVAGARDLRLLRAGHRGSGLVRPVEGDLDGRLLVVGETRDDADVVDLLVGSDLLGARLRLDVDDPGGLVGDAAGVG